MPNKDLYHGHRARLKQRFKIAGPVALADYELLEMLLFFSIPRSDTKVIAKEMIKKFKNLHAVMESSERLLLEIKGVGELTVLLLKLHQALMQRQLKNIMAKKPVLHNKTAVLEYLNSHMMHKKREEFRVLFLDHRNCLIHEELHQTGTVNKIAVYPREIAKRALDVGASGLIIAHNHPSGDIMPSIEDIEVTKKIYQACYAINVILYDHLIVGHGDEYTSMKTQGLF